MLPGTSLPGMRLELKRTELEEERTFGQLFVNGEFFAHTLEDTVRKAGEKKVYAKTAIPAGSYAVLLSWSPGFKRKLPLLVGVPGFDGVRIHRGNSELDTKGCVLVGFKKAASTVYKSGDAEVELIRLITALPKGEEIEITITNPAGH